MNNSAEVPAGHELRTYYSGRFPEKFVSVSGGIDPDRKWWQFWRPKWVYCYTKIVAVVPEQALGKEGES